MNELEKWIVEDMINRLDVVEGLEGYPGDLAFLLYEEDNYNGVITNYAYKEDVDEWIHTYWDDLGEAVEEYEFGCGESLNPFSERYKFMVCIVITMASRLIGKSEYVNEHWNDEITYTAEIIEQIKKELKDSIKDW